MSRTIVSVISAALPVATIVVGLTMPIPGLTQTLSGIRIGDTVPSAIKQIGFPPSGGDRSGPLTYSMWKLGDRNRLSVTTRASDGKIVYMETDCGHFSPTTDFPNFFFGRTSRQELWSTLGSTGIFFSERSPISKETDGSFTTTDIYQITNTDLVVAFVCKIDDVTAVVLFNKGETYSKRNLWKYMLLEAIIVAKRDYIESIWGKYAGAAKSYRPVALEMLQPQTEPVATKRDEIRLSNQNGVKTVPVKINDRLILDFVVDSGAADVAIPNYVFRTLLSTGTVSTRDFIGTEKYTLADGSTVSNDRYLLRKMEIGDHTVTDVVAGVGEANSSLLLGQSFLAKFGSWTLDNDNNILILTDK